MPVGSPQVTWAPVSVSGIPSLEHHNQQAETDKTGGYQGAGEMGGCWLKDTNFQYKMKFWGSKIERGDYSCRVIYTVFYLKTAKGKL